MNNYLNFIRNNLKLKKVLNLFLILFLTIYGPRLHPKLPNYLKELFLNKYFKVIIILLIAYMSSKNIKTAILIAIIYCLLVSFTELESFKNHLFQENFKNNVRNNMPAECIDGIFSKKCIDYCYNNNNDNDNDNEWCNIKYPNVPSKSKCINNDDILNCIKNECNDNENKFCNIAKNVEKFKKHNNLIISSEDDESDNESDIESFTDYPKFNNIKKKIDIYKNPLT